MADEPLDFPVVPLDGVTELRIHGVSGTPVESMLADPHPVQVWGDGTAGYYRRKADGNDGTDHLEAYSWGGLTAGTGMRAAWLLLLPFMLVNLASWAHPSRPADRNAAVGTMSGAVRVLGLVLTATLVLTGAVLGIDVLAWQCAGAAAACGNEHWYTRWLTHGWAAGPGQRIALGALLPVAVVFFVWWLSSSTSKRYEDWGDARDAAPDDGNVPRGARDLSHPRFWHGGGPVARLRSLHLAASYAIVAGLVAQGARSGDPGRWAWLGTVLTAVAAAVVAVVAALLFSPLTGRRRELVEGRPPPSAYCAAVTVLRYGALAALAAALAYAAFLSDRGPAGGTLPGIPGALRARDRTKPESVAGPLFGGYAAPVLAVLGIVVGAAFGAGLTLRVADYLGCVTRCGDTGVAFTLPAQYFWSARSFAVAAFLAFLAALYVLLVARRRAMRDAERDVVTDYPGHTDPARRRAIARIHATAALSDVGGGPFAFVVLGAVVVTGVVNTTSDDAVFAAWLTHVGTWLVGGFAVGLVALGRSAYRKPALRRTVGILWDLGTFWPRAAHPFAPPCYCERTVPELVQRIDQVRANGGRVVVSAHSQGTVIALAALLQTRRGTDGVALLTYGSPLQRFYARAFPHFFGIPVLGWTRQMLNDAWTNLYRRSDPIGGPVRCADADRRLRDPAFARPEYAFDWPVSRGHSHYDHDPAFADSVAALARQVRAR
jgi:hypothetical protein